MRHLIPPMDVNKPTGIINSVCQVLGEKSSVRQMSAIILASTIAFDVFRDSELLSTLPLWTLAINFLYFQLPIRSRALATMHPIALTTSFCSAASYILVLVYQPNFEANRAQDWEIRMMEAVCRSAIVYGAPVIMHAVDLLKMNDNLIRSYALIPRDIQIPWSVLSLFIIEVIHGFMYPSRDDASISEWEGNATFKSMVFNVKILTLSIAFFVLYLSIMRWAYPARISTASNPEKLD